MLCWTLQLGIHPGVFNPTERSMGSREAAATSGDLRTYGHFIDGGSVAPAAGASLATEDPFTGAAWARIARGNAHDANAAFEAAARAFQGPWSGLSATERGHRLWKLGELVQGNASRLAETERRDNGKLASEVIARVKYMGDYFKYYAGLADKVQSRLIPTDKKGVFTYTRYQPKGVVVIITPWNSPLTLTSWKLAPALAAGCTAAELPGGLAPARAGKHPRPFRRDAGRVRAQREARRSGVAGYAGWPDRYTAAVREAPELHPDRQG
jgi:hypothetical protein